MKHLFNILALVISASLFAGGGYKVRKKKVIDKSFTVSADATLNVDNKFGNLSLTSWDKNTVEIHVEVTAEGKDEKKAQEELDRVQIELSGSSSRVSAHTKIDKKNKSWWGGNYKTKLTVNYLIKMPESLRLELENDYGNINLDTTTGSTVIDLDYGNLTIGKLNNTKNDITLDYVGNATIGYVKQANINMDYGKMTISLADKLNWDSDYTDVSISKVNDINFVMDYGNIKLGSVTHAIGDADYIGISIGIVEKALKLSADYGDTKIDLVSPGFEVVDINGDYHSIHLNVSKETHYQLEARTSYARISYPSNLTVQHSEKKKFNKSIRASTGGSNQGRIILDSDYGSIKITQ